MKTAWESSQNAQQIVAVLCHTPDKSCAEHIARRLVRDKAAACVNILPPCRSIYQWGDKLQEENEVPILIKTVTARMGDVESVIRQLHPYETPEIIALPIIGGGNDYLCWVREQCGS